MGVAAWALAVLSSSLVAASVHPSSSPPAPPPDPPAGCWEPAFEQRPWLEPPHNQTLPPHPRLRLNDAQLRQLNASIASNEDARVYFHGMHARGLQMLGEPLVDCGSGTASLDAARRTLEVCVYVCVCVCWLEKKMFVGDGGLLGVDHHHRRRLRCRFSTRWDCSGD